jgi:chromosome segregation ATPase
MTSADHDPSGERKAGLVRRVLSSGVDPEARLEELLAVRRGELEEHAARLRESIAELEQREELLRDSRASVERMLRLGTTELEAREAELTGYLRELTERETALAEAEHDLDRRRQELGAVELKRAAVERRETALAAREAELDEREAQAAARLATSETESTVELAFVPGAQYHLVELEPTLLGIGLALDVGEETYVVARVGASPLPGDARRCAYLVRGNRGRDGSSGSS